MAAPGESVGARVGKYIVLILFLVYIIVGATAYYGAYNETKPIDKNTAYFFLVVSIILGLGVLIYIIVVGFADYKAGQLAKSLKTGEALQELAWKPTNAEQLASLSPTQQSAYVAQLQAQTLAQAQRRPAAAAAAAGVGPYGF